MTDKLRAYLYLHFCVFIWGFTAILGKLITLQAVSLVWWRVFLASSTLLLLIPRKQWQALSRHHIPELLRIGVLVGIHWLCFYGAIKISNASIGVATMATTSFFAALTEPVLLRQKVKWFELGLGLMVLPGMALIAGNLDYHMKAGLLLGLLGAFLAAVFSAMNKRMIVQSPPPPLVMSFVQLSTATVFCSLVLPLWLWRWPDTRVLPLGEDWFWLFLLAWVCTILPHYLTMLAMRHISAFSFNLSLNLEPVYGILLAAVLFREDRDLNPQFYLGMGIILVAVFSHPFIKNYLEKRALRKQPG